MADLDATFPLILVLPGGGYHDHADHEGEPVAAWLRTLGWRARTVIYPVQTRHPAPLDYLRAEIAAERSAGTQMVGVLGFSAGGHFAGHAALAPDGPARARPDFAILCYSVVSMVTATHQSSREQLLGADASDELRVSTSLELLVRPDSPPFFVWATAEDDMVPVVEHAYPLGAALARNGVSHEFHVFERGAHGVGFGEGLPSKSWAELCARWLESRWPS